MADFMQQGEEGVLIKVTVYQEDEETPYDLSGGSVASVEMWLGPPGGEKIAVDSGDGVQFTTDGSDGIVEYAVQAGDIFVDGTWNVQIAWTEGGLQRYSSVTSFTVAANIE